MKKPLLLFALKCSVILYFAACTSIDDYSVTESATPVMTKGTWKVDLFMDSNNDRTNDFSGYVFTFNTTGDIKATRNGIEVNGNWAEDNISKRVTINLGSSDPTLSKLNDYWNIRDVSNANVNFTKTNNPATGLLNIAVL